MKVKKDIEIRILENQNAFEKLYKDETLVILG